LDKTAQSFIGDLDLAFFAQEMLNAPVTAALLPPGQN
jgi:hypothetical protein